jgi:hypothetical protein
MFRMPAYDPVAIAVMGCGIHLGSSAFISLLTPSATLTDSLVFRSAERAAGLSRLRASPRFGGLSLEGLSLEELSPDHADPRYRNRHPVQHYAGACTSHKEHCRQDHHQFWTRHDCARLYCSFALLTGPDIGAEVNDKARPSAGSYAI